VRQAIGDNTPNRGRARRRGRGDPRAVADEMALARVHDAMSYGRSFPA
jgi:hypothetical protein